jgi:hypothetical protein
MNRSVLIAGAIALLAAPAIVSAGVIDSPVPDLAGDPARVAYYVNGVTKNNGLETVFMCTSLDSSGSYEVGVEIFSELGGPPSNNAGGGDGVQTVAAGGSVTIGTGNTVGFHEDEVILSVPANIRGGSARIISTSRRLMCNALVVEELGSPPATLAPLKTIVKRQNGD